ncbi:MAG: MerR family transcriptional regulator [Bacteroidetes bacterium]|nr:MerR family transcriptional regulator [Bacteroidota bacterium]
MNSFTISQLEQFSGIKAHTIRIWEKRYNALRPSRSQGNTRYYDGHQLKRLLNIVSLIEGGTQVAKICLLSDDELSQKIIEKFDTFLTDNADASKYILLLTAAGINLDAITFDRIYKQAAKRFDFVTLYRIVIIPFLNRVGILWAGERMLPSQEHFISNLILQKIYAAIDGLPLIKSSEATWILCLPEGEFHEIGLLFSHYLLLKAGKNSIYMGSNMPLESLNSTAEGVRATHIYVFLVHYDLPEKAQEYINSLIFKFKNCRIMIAGNHRLISELHFDHRIEWVQTIDDFILKL